MFSASCKASIVEKVFSELGLKILPNTKKGPNAVVKFLDSLQQLIC